MRGFAQKLWQRTGIAFFLLFTYILVLIVPTLSMIVGYTLSWSALQEQTQQAQLLTLDRVRDSLDASIQEVYRQMSALAFAPETAAQAKYSEQATVKRAYALAEYRKMVASIEQLLPLSPTLLVYFHESDLIVTRDGLVKRAAFPYYLSKSGLGEHAFTDALQSGRYKDSIIVDQGGTGCKLVLTHRILDASNRGTAGTVLAVLPYQSLAAAMRTDIVSEASILFLSSGGEALPKDAPSDLGDGYLESEVDSAVLPIRYVYCVNKQALVAPLSGLRTLLIGLSAGCLLVGALLMLLFSKVGQRQAEQTLRRLLPEQSPSRRMTVGQIKASIEDLADERAQLSQLQTETNRLAREQRLLDGLEKGRVDQPALQALLGTNEPSDDARYYVVLAQAAENAITQVHGGMAALAAGHIGCYARRGTLLLALLPDAAEEDLLQLAQSLGAEPDSAARLALSLDPWPLRQLAGRR